MIPVAATTEPADGLDGDLTVFAAASLTDAFTAIGEAFESEHPDVDVTFNFAASSDLVTQIIEGAPADVFASADQNNMTRLIEAGLVDAERNDDRDAARAQEFPDGFLYFRDRIEAEGKDVVARLLRLP